MMRTDVVITAGAGKAREVARAVAGVKMAVAGVKMANARRGRLLVLMAAILLLISGTDAHAQRAEMDSPTFMAEGGFFAIVVTDLDASVRWYESNLGLHFVKRGKSPRVPAETVVLGGHNLFVELIHHDGDALPRIDNEASVRRLLKAGVIVARKDFDQMAGYLQKRGVDAGIFEDKEMGVRSFLFRDNDGNLIQFFTQNR